MGEIEATTDQRATEERPKTGKKRPTGASKASDSTIVKSPPKKKQATVKLPVSLKLQKTAKGTA